MGLNTVNKLICGIFSPKSACVYAKKNPAFSLGSGASLFD
jgi:hypothetical protein